MFTGIIETLGEVVNLQQEGENLHLTLASALAPELKIDQSLCHNGVCLTVIKLTDETYTVTAIQETLNKTNLGQLQIGDLVNLERAMKMNARLDGHIVQGHVDCVANCTRIEEQDGSWSFTFQYNDGQQHVTIEKGSITIDGVSLTVVNSKKK